MKCLIQRVLSASVSVDGECKASISHGLLVFLGITHTDSEQTVEKAAEKIRKLRIFEDENGKTNRSIEDVCGELLAVSQFTLYADCRRGNRPGFEQAAAPNHAERLYEHFLSVCEDRFAKVERGIFGADMKVSLINDGPFTILLETE
ncbi:D-tyrosyl-tRNA(Tyr) deacylase [Treponema sp. OMZ 840]|uniref:D-aminoacyl-tRNA deacylase n=1 Tax=Treponema sp. OMZ 840 TaxID=244313 RepID=UPI003D92EE9C